MIIEPTTAGYISQEAGANPGYVDAQTGIYVGLNPPGGHTGRDRAAALGTPLVAMAAGTVIHAGTMPGEYWQNMFWIQGDRAGKCVIIRHWFGYTTLSHCLDVAVQAGQEVAQGQVVARLGTSGASTGPHVHYELLLNGFNVAGPTYGRTNPAAYLTSGVTYAGGITETKDEELTEEERIVLRRILEIVEANESDRIRQRIIAIDDRTATAASRYVKGDLSDTVYEFTEGQLRPVTLDEFKLSMAKGELYRTLPQDLVNALPGGGQ
jgi:hypothetical protein